MRRTAGIGPFIVIAAAPILLGGCSAVVYDFSDGHGWSDDFEQSRLTWEAQGIKSYRYTVSATAGLCGSPPMRVTVKNGIVKKAVYDADNLTCAGSPVRKGESVPKKRLAHVDTIAELFERITACRHTCRASAGFDLQTGIPVRISLINGDVVDDDVFIRITEFRH
ncbi:MAG: DUF6174 domain-containing protein [Pseudomonadota bacterium]